ncbi:hypothetical protein GH714_023204 [Hevea brasiliensis]|uniref:Uncharacterized protein n=1 Tax=Hevea brasiliensis TaxID=3981 RepID=A0A6A6LQN1_HEVBR|nr:hypothetical protein GH714_023204 [Hevea brasiliensis]
MDNPQQSQAASNQEVPLAEYHPSLVSRSDPPQQPNENQIEMPSIDNSQQPLLRDHSSHVGITSTDNSPQNEIENKIKDLQAKSVDIDKRLQELQSRTFQLANIYFVFQAAAVNLVALHQLGSKYIDTLDVQDSIQSKIYELDSRGRGANPLQTEVIRKSKRKCKLVFCFLLLTAFSAIMLSSCWVKLLGFSANF